MAHKICFFGLVGVLGALAVFSAAAHEPSRPLPRSVTVSGQAEARVVPDRAQLGLSVDQLNSDIKAAETAVNKVVREYLAQAKQLGARDEHVSSTGLSIQPEYVWDEKDRRQRLAGYRVRRDMAIQVNDLSKLGDFLLAATKAGVNQVQPPVLESSRDKEIEREALRKAAQDARAKAEVLAETLGARLGPVRVISEGGGSIPPPYPMPKVMAMRAEAADSGNAQMSVSLGEIRFHAVVAVEFELQ